MFSTEPYSTAACMCASYVCIAQRQLWQQLHLQILLMPVVCLRQSVLISRSKLLTGVVWCKISNVNAAASQAVAAKASVTSAYALTVEKAVAERIDTDTAGE